MAKLLHLIVMLVATLCLTGTASAHASLVSSNPAPNEVLSSFPAQFVLSFNEPVSPLVLTLLAPDGASQALSDFKLVDGSVTVPAPSIGMGDGTFVLSYRVVSEDGHPVAGSLIFSIGAPGAEAAESSLDSVDWLVRLAIWLDKTALYLGLLVGVGGVFFWRVIARQAGLPPPILATLVVGAVAAPLEIGLQGLDLLGQPLAALFDGGVWVAGFETSLGPSAILALAAIMLATLASYLRQARSGLVVSIIAFALIGAAFAATGHASAAEPQWLTRPAVFLHGAGVAYWIGALMPLWVLLRGDPATAVGALREFSRTIPFALGALIGTGAMLAIVQLGGFDAVLTTQYGRVFAIKMALVVVLLALAAFNRWRLTKPAGRGEVAATRHLVRALAIEMLLALAILGTVSAWRFTPPPRSMVTLEATQPLSVHIHTDQAMVEITFSSDRQGPMSADVYLMSGEMGALDAKALTLEISNPDAGIEPIRYDANKGADGSWRIDDMTVPTAGTWLLNFAIRVSDFKMVRATEAAEFVP